MWGAKKSEKDGTFSVTVNVLGDDANLHAPLNVWKLNTLWSLQSQHTAGILTPPPPQFLSHRIHTNIHLGLHFYVPSLISPPAADDKPGRWFSSSSFDRQNSWLISKILKPGWYFFLLKTSVQLASLPVKFTKCFQKNAEPRSRDLTTNTWSC